MNPADLVGPVAALALALSMIGLFYTGRILPRNAVPREDYEALRTIVASYAERFGQQTDAVKALTAMVATLASKPAPRR